ncbi:MAG: hypothetical protein Q9169_000029 [Polycauliona sp. 2 TL-2023]
MSFTVLPCTPSDLPTCCAIQFQAYASNPFLSILYPNGGTEALQKNLTYHLSLEHRYPTVQMFRVVDASDQDKTIAFARCTVVDGHPPPIVDDVHAPPVPASDTNEPLFNSFRTAISPLRSTHLAHPPIIILEDLCVTPSYQWRGAGKLLLKSLTDFADERNLPCYVESTPVAYNMYIHQGFREVDGLDIELREWRRGEAVYRTALLKRDKRGVV